MVEEEDFIEEDIGDGMFSPPLVEPKLLPKPEPGLAVIFESWSGANQWSVRLHDKTASGFTTLGSAVIWSLDHADNFEIKE